MCEGRWEIRGGQFKIIFASLQGGIAVLGHLLQHDGDVVRGVAWCSEAYQALHLAEIVPCRRGVSGHVQHFAYAGASCSW